MSEDCLREALRLLNAARRNMDSSAGEPPYFAATNVLVVEIANREQISIEQVAAELRMEQK